MDDLIAFVNARLADEEQDARAATPGPWRREANKVWPPGFELLGRDATHVARQGPAATLARVEALRALVGHVSRPERAYGDDPVAGAVNEDRETTLRYVAALYRLQSDGTVHPDYREEWAP